MSEVRTLLLRCDCSVEHLDLDVWLKPGAEAHTMSLDESYLTVSSELSTSRWRDRLKASWTILRGRTHLLHSVILSPESVAKLRDFAKELPDEGMAR